MKSSGKFTIVIAAALVAGLAAGLLFAPRKGKKTRKRLKKGINELVDSVCSTFPKAKDKMEDVEEKSGDITAA